MSAETAKRNICDVAELAGVSRMTVSRVINNAANVKPDTVMRVRNAMKACGYKPGPVKNRKGRSSGRQRPASYRKMQVALLSGFESFLLNTPVYGKVMHGIEQALAQLDYSMIVRKLSNHAPWSCIPPKIDGAILFQVPTDNPRLLRELRRIPCVRVMGATRKDDFFDHVTYNNSQVGQLAAEYLLSKQHTRAAIFWSGNPEAQYELERHDAFKEALNAGNGSIVDCAGVFIDESSHKSQLPDVRKLMHAVEKELKSDNPPTAIFATADIVAAGLYHVLPHLNMTPGRDIEIIGCNADELYINPFGAEKPASIDIHPEQVGKRAIEQLFWRMANPKEPLNSIKLDVEVVT